MRATIAAACLLALAAPARAADPPAKARSVSDLIEAHDRALIRDLGEYVKAHPKADDLDLAYMAIFEKAIQHDWFADVEPTARAYLAEVKDGAVRPLAQIVTTMARAGAGHYGEALASYRHLIAGLGQDDQQEFASNFADSLATAAVAAGEHEVARQVYEVLLEKFGQDTKLAEKVRGDLTRINMVGKPAPTIIATDLDGKPFRLSELKGKYVLIDFWATWCAPCVAELPNLQAAYSRYQARGLEVVAVSLDETVAPVAEFVRARKLPWRQIHNASCGADVVAAYGVGSIPASFLVAPDGTVVRLELRGKALETALEKLLSGPGAEGRK